ncbi:hypothetical protein I8D64_05335 [Brachybacterium sp. MASK1Z-5]|uniref:PH domain-containing protein n=1 Tax=Brachybacterium halotolerans TaxID=2795215 RepID=A0ABS1B865_9MICO|nr:hypothetical protein [Brachybacterium halotolerans]MBK0330821.1 hypothetical protein [Brachybacterium halotolerans]
MSARRAARRHRDEVGEVLAVHADRPGPLVIGVFVLLWVVFSGLTLINPGESVVLAVAPALAFAIIFGLILLFISGERLVVCERGIVVGSCAPGLRPYVIPSDQIIPGSVVPVTGARRYAAETGTGGFPQSTVRRSAWTRRGIHFVGPSPKQARRHRAVLAPLQDPPPRSIDGRWVWFAGTGSTSPDQVTAQIARAAEVSGQRELARAAAAEPVRELTGDRGDAARQLPGFPQAR